jgi:hypothetical protein
MGKHFDFGSKIYRDLVHGHDKGNEKKRTKNDITFYE